jgi:hypothetical protein
VLLAALLLSCSGERSATPGASPVATGGLPPFPVEAAERTAPRSASVDRSIVLNGTDYFETNALVNGDTTLHLDPAQPGVGPLSWAIYRLEGIGQGLVASEFTLVLGDMVAGESYYYAFADFGTSAWSVQAQTAASATEEVSLLGSFDAARHVSPGGNIYVAVLTHDLLLTVQSLTFRGTHGLPAPRNMYATDMLSPYYTYIWADLVPGATGYEVFYKEAGQPDEFYGFLAVASENEGKVFLEHTANLPVGKPAVFGVEYEYKVRAIADGEDPSPFSEPDNGMRGMPAPHKVIATDQVFEDKIFVVWFSDTQDNLLEYRYRIIRDDIVIDEVVLPNTTGGGSYEDMTVPDFAEHKYQVVQVAPDGVSGISPPDYGCRADYNQTTLHAVGTGDDTRADMEVSPADPTKPAIAAYIEGDNQVVYGQASNPSFNPVAEADVRETMQLTIYDGRPWILFGNHDEAFGPVGVRIARGKIAGPTSEEHWDVYTILECDLYAEELAMEVIGGRLALMFADESGEDYILRYAYPNVDDPQVGLDWEVFKVETYGWLDRPLYFDLAERQGLPLAAVQRVEVAIDLLEAASAQPGDQGDWTVYPVEIGTSVAGPQGVDLLVRNDVAYIPFIESDIEGVGRIMLMYSTQWPPVGEFAWFPSFIDSVNGDFCTGPSIAFVHNQPWISFSHGGRPGPVIASHLYDEEFNDGSWGGGLWFVDTVDEDPEFQESRNDTTLLEIDGEPAILYQMRNSGPGYTLRLAQMADKPE